MFIDGRGAQAGDTNLPTGILRIASDQDYPADHRSEQIHEIPPTALRSFYFFQRIERLELEARRLAGLTGDGPASTASRKQIVNDVAVLRRDGEMKSYIDLLFLALVVLLCVSKIVTD